MQGIEPIQICEEERILLTDSISIKKGKYAQVVYDLLPMASFKHKCRQLNACCIKIESKEPKKCSKYIKR